MEVGAGIGLGLVGRLVGCTPGFLVRLANALLHLESEQDTCNAYDDLIAHFNKVRDGLPDKLPDEFQLQLGLGVRQRQICLTDAQTGRWADRGTERGTDRKTDRQAERESERFTDRRTDR